MVFGIFVVFEVNNSLQADAFRGHSLCRFRFSLSRLQQPDSWVISHSGCAAKNAASPVRLMPIESTRALSLFFVQAPAPSSLGHKPTQLCGKVRHFAGLSYARQSYTGASAFLPSIHYKISRIRMRKDNRGH